MNTEVWIEDLDAKFPTIKLTKGDAEGFRIPRIGEHVGAWQDDHVKNTETYNLLEVQDVRYYVFERGAGALKMWVQEIHVMCSENFGRRRR